MRSTITAVILSSVFYTMHPASAGGLIGDIFSTIGSDIGKQLDEAHKQLGAPLDRATADPTMYQNITNLCKQNPKLEQCILIFGPAIDTGTAGDRSALAPQ
jgi:hypothetical protein